MKDLLVEEVKHVAMSQVIPEDWHDWFFSALSGSSTFTWGDANFTLVHADRFMEELESILSGEDEMEHNIAEHREAVIDTLKYLSVNNIYVDLEA
jgi:hypothetical protein